jgi:hypothetical protein
MRRTLYAEPVDRETRRTETVAAYTAIDNCTNALRRLHKEARITAEVSQTAPWPTRCAAALERDHYLRMLMDLETRRMKVQW